jgi:hypothetical protein
VNMQEGLSVPGIEFSRPRNVAETSVAVFVQKGEQLCIVQALHGAAAADVAAFKRDVRARLRVLAWWHTVGLTNISLAAEPSDSFVAACTAALATWKWPVGKAAWRHPAKPSAQLTISPASASAFFSPKQTRTDGYASAGLYRNVNPNLYKPTLTHMAGKGRICRLMIFS